MIQPVKEKIILGIDPGTTIMGYGVLRVKGTKPEMIAMGIIDLRKFANHYLKLRHIHERVLSIIESYLPDELAIEAPFFGKNVQSMLKWMLRFPKEDMPTFMDATDGLAAAYCHFLQMGRPTMEKGYNSWKDFIAKNPDKVK